MHFVFDEVCQLEHVGVTYGDRVIERLTCAPIVELYFAAGGQIGAHEYFFDVLFRCSIEDGCGNLEAQFVSSPAQVRFHDLTNVHAVWHSQRIENDVHRRAIGQERHVFYR
jgi:hypothetical protein